MNLKLNLKTDKIKMKKITVSKKEKNLILFLFMLAIVFLFFRFIYTPQKDKIALMKADIEANMDKTEAASIVLAKEKAIDSQLSELRYDYEFLSEKYYPTADQPGIMQELNKIIDEEELLIHNISFSSPVLMTIGDLQIERQTISLPYRGYYNDLNSFLKKLEAHPKKILVNQLSISKDEGDLINGQISIEIFTNGGLSPYKDAYFYNNFVPNYHVSPFKAFDSFDVYEEEIAADDDSLPEFFEDIVKRTVIDDLEADNIYFMGTSSNITGKVNKINLAKYGKSSIRAEYYISTDFNEGRAYMVLDDRDISLKYPPSSIGIWAYSYGYSPVTIGFRLQDPDGRKIDLELAKGMNWIGWQYISASPPSDINIYPLKLDRVYMELGPNRDEFGVILFDRIEAEYPKKENISIEENEEEGEGSSNYVFYVVKPGETLMDISEKFYGSRYNYTNIMKDNGLSDSMIFSDQVLTIRSY